MTFAAPPWLYAPLLLVPSAVLLFVWAERRAARRLARLAAPALRAGLLAHADSPGRRRVRFGLWTLAMATLAVALARPQWGFEEQPVKRRGLDLLVAVDVSKSMLATDLAPSRLGRARLAVLDLLALLPGDRVGLIAFAGTAFLQAPLTIDYSAIRDAVGELDPDLIPRGGTDISGALDTALDAFGKAEGANRAILLLTDGEDLGADTLAAAERVKKAGVRVFTVGLGTSAGASIPLPRGSFDNSSGGAIARERDGRPHVSKLDEERLRAIAAATGGQYAHLTGAAGRDSELRGLVTGGLGAMQTADIDARANRRPIERYQWPLGLALGLLGASACVGERRRERPVQNRSHESHPTRGTQGRPTRIPVTAGVALAGFLAALPGTLHAAVTPPSDPRSLYDRGRYQEAWEAYTELLKKNPGSGRLQFNAGASAYAAGQFDPALDNFTRALAAPNLEAPLQARTLYNLGNTLFKRGEAQKPGSDSRRNDWKNAIQYYNSVLQAPRGPGANPSADDENLRRDAEHNRDLVQRRLDEESNNPPPPPKPPPKKPDDKKKDKGKDKDKDKDKSEKGDPSDQGQSDKPEEGGQGENGRPGQGPPKPDNDQGQGGDADQPPAPDARGGKGQNPRPQRDPNSTGDQSDDQQPDEDADRPPQSGAGGGDSPDQQANQPSPNSSNRGQKPQPEPERPGPRPQGDLTARDSGGSQSPAPGEAAEGEPTEANGQAAGGGHMSAAQARALLGSLRNEDDRVQLLSPNPKKRSREAVFNDW